jgi:outer membrane protein assembly factor BamB
VVKSCFNLFGGGDSESVLCFSLKNQEIIWQHHWPVDTFSNDIENNVYSYGKRCFSVINGRLVFAFNTRSGEKELIYDSKDYDINHGPIIIDASHFGILETKIGEDEEDYRYTIINPISGEILSRRQLPYDKKVRATISNVIVQNRTIFYTDAAHTAAIDALTGEILWTRTDEGFQCQEGLHLSNGILLKHNTETFMAFNSENGEEVYFNSSFGFGESTLYGNYLYCNDCEGHIIVLEYISGIIVDNIKYPKDNNEFRFGGNFSHFPIIQDNKLYLIGQNASNNKDYRVFCYPTYPWNK